MWTNNGNYALSRSRAASALRFQAKDVYLVLGGHGTLTIVLGGREIGTVNVDGYPRLLHDNQRYPALPTSLLQLDMSPGISAYDFTFG